MDATLYIVLTCCVLATIITVIVCWRCCKRKYTGRKFNKLDESEPVPDEGRRTNGDHVNDYASVREATTGKYPVTKTKSQDASSIDSNNKNTDIATDTKSDNTVVGDDAKLPKDSSTDWSDTGTATTISIDDTNHDANGKTSEIREEEQDSCDLHEPDDVNLINDDQPNIVMDQLSSVQDKPITDPDLDQQTAEPFEEAFIAPVDKTHSDTVVERYVIKTMTVQVLSSTDIPIVRNAAEELIDNLDIHALSVIPKHIQSMANVSPELPLLIICVHTSRLGTDATNAVKGLLHPKSTVLLILHHQEEHALPVTRSDRILVDPQFDDIGGILDFAYMSDSGLYSCDMNTTCIDELEKFIRSCLRTKN